MSDSVVVDPDETTVYRLTATGAGGSSFDEATLTVNPAAAGAITATITHTDASRGVDVSGPAVLPATVTSDFYNSQCFISATSSAGLGPITVTAQSGLVTGFTLAAGGSTSAYLSWSYDGSVADTPQPGTYPIVLRFADTYGNTEDKTVTVVVRQWWTKATRIFVGPRKQGTTWSYNSYGTIKQSVSGTVTLDLYIADQVGSSQSGSNLTVQWYKDNVAWGSPQAGNATKSWVTTSDENRAYVVESRITAVSGGQMPGYRSLPTVFAVGNGAPKVGSYTVGVTEVSTAAAGAVIFDTQNTGEQSVKPSYITFPGSRARRANSHPLTHTPPTAAADDTERTALKLPTAWVIVPWLGTRNTWGYTAPSWFCDDASIVFVGQHFPRVGVESTASNTVAKKFPGWCGHRGDNSINEYCTFAFVPGGVTGALALELDGRIAHLRANGSIRTVVGYAIAPGSTVVPKDPRNSDISAAEVKAHQETLVAGDFSGYGPGEFDLPNDLCFDVDDASIVYVADTDNWRIAKVTFNDDDHTFNAPVVTEYCEFDNDVRCFSLVQDDDGHLWVVDIDSGDILKVDAATQAITTLCNIPRAQVIRLNSLGQLIVGSTPTGTNQSDPDDYAKIWRVNRSTGTATLIKATRFVDQTFIDPPTWIWLAVDRNGTVGPTNAIYFASSLPASDPTVPGLGDRSTILAVYVDGSGDMTSAASWMNACDGTPYVIGRPATDSINDPFGHYPWAVEVNPYKAEFLTTGYGGLGVCCWRKRVGGDPDSYSADIGAYNRGLAIMLTGTVPGWPTDSRSSLATVHGRVLENYMGPAVRRVDELAALSDGDLNTAIQAGLDTGEARPEITGDDLRDLRYYIRQNSLQGFLADVRPDADQVDTTAPTISSVSATPSGTQVTIVWTTSESAIGFIEYGPDDYYGRHKLESAFATSHSEVITSLVSATYHYRVAAKDAAGNVRVDSDRTFVIS